MLTKYNIVYTPVIPIDFAFDNRWTSERFRRPLWNDTFHDNAEKKLNIYKLRLNASELVLQSRKTRIHAQTWAVLQIVGLGFFMLIVYEQNLYAEQFW